MKRPGAPADPSRLALAQREGIANTKEPISNESKMSRSDSRIRRRRRQTKHHSAALRGSRSRPASPEARTVRLHDVQTEAARMSRQAISNRFHVKQAEMQADRSSWRESCGRESRGRRCRKRWREHRAHATRANASTPQPTSGDGLLPRPGSGGRLETHLGSVQLAPGTWAACRPTSAAPRC